jgi:predicted metal-dependent HD superfamily phosphohydrolase
MHLVSSRYQSILAGIGVPEDKIAALWDETAARYDEAHRHYHRVAHIAAMLKGADDLQHDETALILAIIYHDVIYDPAKQDNEAQSAALFRLHLGAYISPALCEQICRMIEATKSHRPSGDALTDLLLDLDMAILGAPWPDYQAYAEGVAQEYIPVYGNEAYAAGRDALFLTPVLDQPRIFLTPEFVGREAQARENLAKERELWVTGFFADPTGDAFRTFPYIQDV